MTSSVLDPAPRASVRPRRKPWWRKRPVNRSLVWTHRWMSLVLGIVLLVITTSGAILVYAPEIQRWTHPSVFTSHTSAHPTTFEAAIDTVAAAHPSFGAASVNVQGGIIQVSSNDASAHPGFYGVDPGTGRITGYLDPDGGFMGLMVNLHECGLTCEGYTGYIAALTKPVPWVSTHLISGTTWGGLILALMGVLLLFLAISGAITWWPGIKRWRHGFRVRRRNRYTRDFDLHKLVGLVAVPFLLMWGVTGASFEIPAMNTWWYSLTGGHNPPADQYDFASNAPAKGAHPHDIGITAAVNAAMKAAPGTVVNAYAPDKGTTKDGYYSIWLSAGIDPYKYGEYPGQVGVYVDRWNPHHLKVVSHEHASTVSNQLWDTWRYGMFHFGYAVNGWWRFFWFAFGLTPLFLAWTGVSTWLYKRGVAKRKKKALAERAAAAA